MAPVRGLLADISYLLEDGAPLPVRGEVITINTLSAERGSTPFSSSSQSIFVLKNLPPRKSSRSVSVTGYSPIFPLVRSISSTLPIYPLYRVAIIQLLVIYQYLSIFRVPRTIRMEPG